MPVVFSTSAITGYRAAETLYHVDDLCYPEIGFGEAGELKESAELQVALPPEGCADCT